MRINSIHGSFKNHIIDNDMDKVKIGRERGKKGMDKEKESAEFSQGPPEPPWATICETNPI